jgi:hypothetical protein
VCRKDSHIVYGVEPGFLRAVPADRLARQIGLARAGLGVSLLAAPVPLIRMVGVDTATARRMAWVTRMAAARDLALGAGTVAAVRSAGAGGDARDGARWVAIGAAADVADTLIITAALRAGRFGTIRGALMAGSAVGGAVLGAVAAVGLRRG